jgi:hypothetical protein
MSQPIPAPTTDDDPAAAIPIGDTNAIELPPAESRAVIEALLADLGRARTA